MASQFNSNAPLPQGFSVYQPQLGAQLQFFPALGSQELDDMMNAYIPGPAALKEKRATISLDFLEHSQLTGQTFKFYPVYYSSSPIAASPVNSIATSSFNTSPVNSTLDWSQASASPSVSSRSSISKSRRTSKSSNMVARYSAIDLSNLPGMKIMTKDGEDVTDSASRGSKTKEQRDHAHLMRIIKACDSCRRKKIRCDPDHKKRSTSQAQAQSLTKSAKKARTSPPAAATPTPLKPVAAPAALSTLDDNPGKPMSMLGIDPTFTFAGLDSFESMDQTTESWEEFIQYPDDNYDFFLDPQGYFSSSQSSASSSSASPLKVLTPASQQESLAVSGLEEREGMLSQSTSPQLPFLQDNHTGSATNYTDFNLFSPSSSFSEDDRMLPISSSRQLSQDQPFASESETASFNSFLADGNALSADWSGASEPVSPLETGLVAAANTSLSWYDPGHSSVTNRDEDSRASISRIPETAWVGGVRIAHPPGGSLLVTMDSGRGVEVIANGAPPGRSDGSGSGSGSGIVSIAIHGSDTPANIGTSRDAHTALQLHGDIQDGLLFQPSPTEIGRIASEPPVGYSPWVSFGQADNFLTELASEQSTVSTASSMANAANRSDQFSTGSEESQARVQTELAMSQNVMPDLSPGGSQASSSELLAASTRLSTAPFGLYNRVPDSVSPAVPDEHALRISSAANRSGMSAQHGVPVGQSQSGARILANLQSINSHVEQLNGESDLQERSVAPVASLADNGIQPRSPLLQALSPRATRATDEPAALAQNVSSGKFSLRQVQTTQTNATMLVGILASAMLVQLVGLSAVFSFGSLVLTMTSIVGRMTVSQGVKHSFETTPSTMSSSRSRGGKPRHATVSHQGDQRFMSGSYSSRLSSRLSSFFDGAMTSVLVTPSMG